MSIQDLQSAGIISPVDIGIDGVQAYTATPPDSTEESQVSLKTYNERCDELNTLSRLSNDAVKEIERLRNEVSKLLLANDTLSMEKSQQESREYKDEESILTTLTNVLTNNPKFINSIASSLADHQDFNQRSDIDYYTLARELDMDELGKAVADHFDFGDIAEWVSVDYYDLAAAMDYSDLASNIDYTDLASAIEYEDTIRDEVRERMEDLELRNVTVNFS